MTQNNSSPASTATPPVQEGMPTGGTVSAEYIGKNSTTASWYPPPSTVSIDPTITEHIDKPPAAVPVSAPLPDIRDLIANLEQHYAALVASKPLIGDEPWESDKRRYEESRKDIVDAFANLRAELTASRSIIQRLQKELAEYRHDEGVREDMEVGNV